MPKATLLDWSTPGLKWKKERRSLGLLQSEKDSYCLLMISYKARTYEENVYFELRKVKTDECTARAKISQRQDRVSRRDSAGGGGTAMNRPTDMGITQQSNYHNIIHSPH